MSTATTGAPNQYMRWDKKGADLGKCFKGNRWDFFNFLLELILMRKTVILKKQKKKTEKKSFFFQIFSTVRMKFKNRLGAPS